MNRDGVYKNLSITSISINSRSDVSDTTLGDKGFGKVKYVNAIITGIADMYDVVGFGRVSYRGRINFVVDKDFRFFKSDETWIGYIYDEARDRQTLRFKKIFLR